MMLDLSLLFLYIFENDGQSAKNLHNKTKRVDSQLKFTSKTAFSLVSNCLFQITCDHNNVP